MKIGDIPEVDRALKKEFKAHSAPIIELIEAQTHDPFCVLVGTILSARTKDACTAGAVRRLFAKAKGACFAPEDLERLTAKEIEKLIFPVGFYHDKAKHLKELPKVLKEKFDGVLPNTVEELCELPGVGRKTANLTVAVGFDLPAICGSDNLDGASKLNRARVLLRTLSETVPSDTRFVLIGDALHDKEVADALGIDCILCAQGSHAAWRLRAVAPTGDTLVDALKLAMALA